MLDCVGDGLRHHDRVNDVNHAVGLDHVVGGNVGDVALRVFEQDVVFAIHRHRELFARDGGEHRFALAGFDLLGEFLERQVTSHDVVGQDLRERVLVLRFHEVFHRAGREFAKRRVRRGEDRERARALQRVHEAGCLDGGHERRVIFGVHGVLNDVFGREHVFAANDNSAVSEGHGGGQGQHEGCELDIAFHICFHSMLMFLLF